MSNLSIDIERITPGIVNGFCPLPGIATGGQPGPDDISALARAGVRTILDTREPGERRGYDEVAEVARVGMTYVNVPVGTSIDDTLFDRVRDVLRREERPVLVHCATGNRVGLVLIPYLMLDEGRSADDAVKLAVRMGMRSPQLAEFALRYVARAQSREK